LNIVEKVMKEVRWLTLEEATKYGRISEKIWKGKYLTRRKEEEK